MKASSYNDVTMYDGKVVKQFIQGSTVEQRDRFHQESMGLMLVPHLSQECTLPKLLWPYLSTNSDSYIEIERIRSMTGLDALLSSSSLEPLFPHFRRVLMFSEEYTSKTTFASREPIKVYTRISKYLHIYQQYVHKALPSLACSAMHLVPRLPHSFSHGDLKPDNVLVEEDNPIPIVIDWEHFSAGEKEYDTATFFANSLIRLLIQGRNDDAASLAHFFMEFVNPTRGWYACLLSRSLLEFSPGIKRREYDYADQGDVYVSQFSSLINAMCYTSIDGMASGDLDLPAFVDKLEGRRL